MSNLIFQQQGSSPAQAGAGYSQLYAKTDGIVYQQVGTNTEVPIMSGAQVGKILQVVHAIDSTKLRTAADTYAATGLSATITPVSTSSKILIHMNSYVSTDNVTVGNGSTVNLKLKRGTTDIVPSMIVMYTLDQTQSSGNARTAGTISHIFLDEPGSTDALTYNYEMKADGGANNTAWLHDTWGGAVDQTTLPPMSATIVLQEIAG